MRLRSGRPRGRTGRRHIIPARTMLVVALATLTYGCGGDAMSGPGQSTLSGSLLLQDVWGNNLDDFSGVTVNVDGLGASAVTDKNGDWRIGGLVPGRYDITLKKDAFGTLRIFDQPVVGASSVAPTITMARAATHQAIVDSVHVGTLSGTEFYFIDGHLSAPPPANAKGSAAVVFLSTKSESVSSDPASYQQWNASISLSSSATFTMALPVDGTRSTFGQGVTIFVAGYATSVACSCYTDPTTKNRVFSNAGPRANVVRFTVK